MRVLGVGTAGCKADASPSG